MKCLFLYYNTALSILNDQISFLPKEYWLRAQGSSIHNGIAYLSGIAKSMHVECKLFDVSYIEPGKISSNFRKTCIQFEPDIIAITCFTQNWNHIKKILNDSFSQDHKKRPIIIIGGPHPTAVPETVISFPLIDIVAIGEGEIAFRQIIEYLQGNQHLGNISGIWYKENSHIIKNSPSQLIRNLDDLPIPDWEIFNRPYLINENVDFEKREIGVFNTSRGCLYKCAYCESSYFQEIYSHEKRYYREKSTERIIGEIESKFRKYQFSEIIFHDELFISNLSRLQELSEIYKKKIRLPFIAQTRPESLNDKTLSLIKDMGVKELRIGIECGNEEYRRNILKRKISNQSLIDIFTLIKNYNIKTMAYNIIGFPFETKKMICETIELNKKLYPDQTYVNIYQPIPGTSLFKTCRDNNLFVKSDPYRLEFGYDRSIIKTDVSSDDLRNLKRLFPNVV